MKRRDDCRISGIAAAGNMPWGTHCCLLYKKETELLEILVPYFKAGLENNEFCVWVRAAPADTASAKAALGVAMPEFARYLKRGQIQFLPYDKWYLKNGVFNRKNVLSGWSGKLRHALSRGYVGLRVSGDANWIDKHYKAAFSVYESEAGKALACAKMIALCSYSLSRLEADEIANVVGAHQQTLLKKGKKWQFIRNVTYENEAQSRRETEHEKKALFDLIPDPAWIKDKAGRFIIVNTAFGSLRGEKPEYFEGKTNRDVLPKELAAKYRDMDIKAMKSGGRKYVTELLPDANGRLHWFETARMPIYNDSREVAGLVGIARDITEHKRAQEDIICFSRQLMRVREDEKRKISALLHDEIGSMAVNLGSLLSLAADDIAREGGAASAAEKIDKAGGLMKLLAVRVKNICAAIRPPAIEISGLCGALRELVDKVGGCTEIRIWFNASLCDEGIIPENAKIVIYRIAQEALNNAVKYSGAKTVRISVWRGAGKTYLSVVDDGAGFDAAKLKSRGSRKKFGLRIMREEADSAGMLLQIDSKPGRGTAIRVELPLKRG